MGKKSRKSKANSSSVPAPTPAPAPTSASPPSSLDTFAKSQLFSLISTLNLSLDAVPRDELLLTLQTVMRWVEAKAARVASCNMLLYIMS